jgi:hypothetical protein
MRAIGLVAAAAMLLGGCGSPKVATSDAAGNAAPPAPAAAGPAAEAPAPAPPPITADSIPAAFHGVYDGSREACAGPSDQRLTVSAGELRFHESIGSVRKVASEPSGAIRVEADYQGEGESWRSTRRLSLSEGGAALTVSGDGTSLVRVRCPKGEL